MQVAAAKPWLTGSLEDGAAIKADYRSSSSTNLRGKNKPPQTVLLRTSTSTGHQQHHHHQQHTDALACSCA